jgi:hypothetical protein
MKSDTPDLQNILRRVEILEKKNKRFRRLVPTVLLLGVGALAVIGATGSASAVLSAHKFVLLDAQGRPRLEIATPASLGTTAVGLGADDPGIWISDEKGHDRAIILSDRVSFQDEAGKERAALRMQGDSPELALLDDHGRKLAALYAMYEMPVLDLTNGNAKRGVRMMAGESDTILDLYDPRRQQESKDPGSAIAVGLYAHDPSIILGDEVGFETRIGSTNLVTPHTGGTYKTSAASLVLFGKDGKVLWSVP